ncbi:MAG: hypothetical protein JXI43_14350 [Tissierellales bacterium]|nr:hypothetical protein [Tissierellales bacterium]
MEWKNLEVQVRELASCHWGCDASQETINGVRADCVLKKHPDYWIIIEISTEETLSKLRTDIAKFATIRPYLFSQNIYAECYFVCIDPSDQLRISGKGNNLKVMSIEELRGMLLGYDIYYNLRSKQPFGSAIDRKSGKRDDSEYISVEYESIDGKNSYSIKDISQLLLRGEKVILLGDYGTGKSRCIQETFFALHDEAINNWYFPISIDLRENWGIQRAHELLRRHFADLGASEIGESVLRLLGSKRLILLIDGFDEIASQTWSNDPEILKNIRKQSLSAVSDLLSRVNCGILITGREYYFNSPEEMFRCFGLNARGTYVLRCSNEFSEEQIQNYLKRLKGMTIVPEWLPKRPLICQILADLDSDVLNELVSKETGEIRFWSAAIQAICEREAKIKSILDDSVIMAVLVGLANITRIKPRDLGPISPREINDIFQTVTGAPPNDESAVILQRLPLLGRVESQSSDRQFVDTYFLDGLRAEDVCQKLFQQDETILSEVWRNPLRPFGIRLLANEIFLSADKTSYIRFLRRSCDRNNRILASDLICAILSAHDGTFAFDGISLSESHIACLDISGSSLSGLQITNSFIDELIITEAHPTDVKITNCIIGKVDGVSEASGLPGWVSDNEVGEYVRVNTVTRIKQANLSSEQKVFITIIKKTFFQPGAGRKEEALLRGLGSSQLKKSSEKILKMLIREGILKTAPGKDGLLYIPQRAHAHRMKEILNKLTLSDDELWKNLKQID